MTRIELKREKGQKMKRKILPSRGNQQSDGREGGAASNPGSGSEAAPGGEGRGISLLRIEGTRNGGENG